MNSVEKHPLFFWLPNFPEVMESFLTTLVQSNRFDIKIFCLKKLPEERLSIYTESALSRLCEITYFDGEQELSAFFDRHFSGAEEGIHIFGGFLGSVGECLYRYQTVHGGKKAIVLTEKPSALPYQSKAANLLLRNLKRLRMFFLYSRAYRRNRRAIAAVLVTGQKGVNQLAAYGVDKARLFSFMYSHIDEELPAKKERTDKTVKFVYVGRFNFCNRGLDNLMYAFDRLHGDDWSLDLVGGYGEDADEIIRWAQTKKNVRYLGAWNSDEVITKMQDYDVSVNPTKVDGWRIQINQAILAGIATITTNEAISDELVRAADCGLVVNAFRKKELLRAITAALDNPEQLRRWKENAVRFAPRISNEALADYFIQITDYITQGKENKERPVCPWQS